MTADNSTKKTGASKKADSFTDAEREAMKERAKEMKAEARAGKNKELGEADALAKIAEMPEPDRSMATHIHDIVKQHAPELAAKTWYGMPAYARGVKVVLFFQTAAKFESRYCTLGFNDSAHLDDGPMWPVSFAMVEWTPDVEQTVIALVKKAAG